MKPHFPFSTGFVRPLFLVSFFSLSVGIGTARLAAQHHDLHDHDQDEHLAPEGEHDDHEDHDGAIHLEPEDIIAFGIQVAVARAGTIHEELRFPGEIRMNEDRVAHVSPRFDGIATAIHHRLGDRVHTGALLAEMESNDTLRPFQLIAPIEGTIVAFHLTLGENLEAGAYAYIIADTSTVWADLSVFQRDLPKISVGQQVQLSAGHGYPAVSGEIAYLGPVVDETTRTGLARVILKNPVGIYRPGLFIIGNVLLQERAFEIVVPTKALQEVDGRTVVFVEAEHEEGFEPREVTVGHRDAKFAEIRSGLSIGDHYVAEGAFFLKADAAKENFGDGHGH